ncbi:MAG: EAL domain-containing protein [Woeseiaceae bacterium]
MAIPLKRASDKDQLSSSVIPLYVDDKQSDHFAEDLLSVYYDALIGVNKAGEIIFLNKSACKITGWVQADAKKLPIPQVFQFCNDVLEQSYLKIIAKVIETGQIFGPVKHHTIKNKKNTEIFIDFSISPLDDDTVIFMFHRLNKNNPSPRPLVYQFSHDALTRIANRSTLQQSIDHLHSSYRKIENTTYSLLLIDVDRFKLINEHYGHHQGDQLLQLLAERLQHTIRDKDNIGRWGGEEFLCLLPDTDIDTAVKIAERFCSIISTQPFNLQNKNHPDKREQHVPLSISIGVANYPHDGLGPDDLFRIADSTLQQAKSNGRNRIHSSLQNTENTISIGTQLEKALNEDRITPVYQPIFSLSTGQKVAEEALARIKTSSGKLIEAGEFIDAAVELQLVHRIDHKIIKEMLKRCAEGFIDNSSPLPHFVNMSADLLRHPELVKDIIEFAMKKAYETGQLQHEVKPIVIEITEQELLGDMDEIKTILAPFIDFGIQLAIDDFGSGYSSLTYLADLPIKYLKFDGALIKRIANEDKARKIINGIQKMAESLELITIAEHIEDQKTLDILREIGVSWGQGYYSGLQKS